MLCLPLKRRVTVNILVDHRLVEVNVYGVPCWHKMVEVVCTNKSLDLGPLLQLLLTHFLGDLAWITLNTSNEGMTVRLVCRAFIIILYNHSFSSCEAATQDQNNLSWFHEAT